MTVPSYDLAPTLGILAVGLVLAALAALWVALRHRGPSSAGRLRALTLLTLALVFDLVLLGAFTRLSDSGLGCPDWPGCYGFASPFGAREHIASAEALVPSGAVTHTKAWIEMSHRYAATAIGGLIVVLTVLSVVAARRGRLPVSPAWSVATLVWVCVQGAFGAWTVTMKLYPAIVTLHLLGGLALLALLVAQAEAYAPRPLPLRPGLRALLIAVSALVVVQIALGGWVSTNYAVLACRDFPTCQGVWWPPMDAEAGFAVLRPLGMTGDGSYLPFAALTAIHMAHRLGALVVAPLLLLVAWRLLAGSHPAGRAPALAVVAAVVWQVATGVGNVVLGWPLVAAVGHTAGAAVLVSALTLLLMRAGAAGRTASALPATGRRRPPAAAATS